MPAQPANTQAAGHQLSHSTHHKTGSSPALQSESSSDAEFLPQHTGNVWYVNSSTANAEARQSRSDADGTCSGGAAVQMPQHASEVAGATAAEAADAAMPQVSMIRRWLVSHQLWRISQGFALRGTVQRRFTLHLASSSAYPQLV